jgi:hypothetical protein
MNRSIPGLSEKDNWRLRSIELQELPEWMKALGLLLFSLGVLLLLFWLMAWLFSSTSSSSPWEFTGGLGNVMLGTNMIQEYRYRRLLKHVLETTIPKSPSVEVVANDNE